LTDQLKRAANSVAANIAEAHGRYHFADKCRVLFVARGECEEVRSHLSIALGLNYLDRSIFDRIDYEYNGLEIGINSYISSLKDVA
jgi:four helix bundle protein